MGRTAGAVLGLVATGLLGGCRSAYVQTDLVNRTERPITVVEVDYPDASFGTQMLAPGKTFHYRFKVLGQGAMKITYTDAGGQEHTAGGPTLHEGAEGSLTILIGPNGVVWTPNVHPRN